MAVNTKGTGKFPSPAAREESISNSCEDGKKGILE